jgi:hypothetical protein
LRRRDAEAICRPTACVCEAGVLAGSTTPLTRHFDDEEDVVVPMLTLHGDPFELKTAGRLGQTAAPAAA